MQSPQLLMELLTQEQRDWFKINNFISISRVFTDPSAKSEATATKKQKKQKVDSTTAHKCLFAANVIKLGMIECLGAANEELLYWSQRVLAGKLNFLYVLYLNIKFCDCSTTNRHLTLQVEELIVYSRPEDEFFHKHCSTSYTFSTGRISARLKN